MSISETRSKEISSRLDVAARGVDLLTSLIDVTSAQLGAVKVALEIGRWLQHERLNEADLQTCWEIAKDRFAPNEQGILFHSEVANAPNTKCLPFFLQQAGSLGRYMCNDHHLSWMVSTIACLFHFHDQDFVSKAVVEILLPGHTFAEETWTPVEKANDYIVRRQLTAVVPQTASSVWLNVVNSGHST